MTELDKFIKATSESRASDKILDVSPRKAHATRKEQKARRRGREGREVSRNSGADIDL